jgi:transposase-like protein
MSKRARIRAEEKIRIARECIAGKISQAEAEALTGVSKTVVADWIRLYVTEGASAFLPKRGNRLLLKPFSSPLLKIFAVKILVLKL